MTDDQVVGWVLLAFFAAALGTSFVLIAPGMFDAFVALFARFV